MLAQSGSANVTPNGCQGRPQWKSPPMNSNAVRCVCGSIVPRTSPIALAPLKVLPRASTWASGSVVQPFRFLNSKRGPPTGKRLPVVAEVSVYAVLDTPLTFQTAASVAVGDAVSAPFESIAGREPLRATSV